MQAAASCSDLLLSLPTPRAVQMHINLNWDVAQHAASSLRRQIQAFHPQAIETLATSIDLSYSIIHIVVNGESKAF